MRLGIWVGVIAAAVMAQTPSFRVSTRLIQVNVIVNDRRGEPVTGLSKDDFTIFDRGKAQKIAFFSEQTAQPAENAPTAPAAQPFSNRQTGSVTAILFDRLNTKFSESAFAKARLAKFLEQVRPDDRIALYGLSDKLVVLHDFTEDREALMRALAGFKPAQTELTTATVFDESNTGHPGMDWFENKGNQKFSDTEMIGRVRLTVEAMIAITNHLQSLPGRKNLVWISGSFPISIGYLQKRIMGARPTRDDFSAEAEKGGQALSNANVAIYPIDAHVLATLGGAYDGSKAPKPGLAQLQATVPMPETQPVTELATMGTLADDTGGRVFSSSNDIAGMVRRAIDDSRFTYALGYYPDHEKWNGEFREIKVKVQRPGVEARYRRGYLAIAETALAVAPVSLSEVIRRPVESGELGLELRFEPEGPHEFKVHLKADASAMRFEQKDGRWDGQLEVLFVQLGRDDNDVASHGQTLTFHLSQTTHESSLRDGLKISATEKIDEHATELRVAARDPATGVVGSVFVPVERIGRE